MKECGRELTLMKNSPPHVMMNQVLYIYICRHYQFRCISSSLLVFLHAIYFYWEIFVWTAHLLCLCGIYHDTDNYIIKNGAWIRYYQKHTSENFSSIYMLITMSILACVYMRFFDFGCWFVLCTPQNVESPRKFSFITWNMHNKLCN